MIGTVFCREVLHQIDLVNELRSWEALLSFSISLERKMAFESSQHKSTNSCGSTPPVRKENWCHGVKAVKTLAATITTGEVPHLVFFLVQPLEFVNLSAIEP